MLQSTSTSGTGSSSSNSSGGHQSAVKEQHLGPTISNTVALHSLQSGDCDVAVHVHRPTVSCTSSSNSNTYTLFLSFAVTFVAVHQLLVHPLLTLLMTSSSTTTSQTSHYHAKRCVETSEPNIFHCTDHATTPSRSNSKNSGGGDHKRNSYRQSNEQQRGKDHNNIVLQDNHNKDDDVITNEYRGVAQYVLGSEEEMRDIAEVLQSMEQYWRRWMLKTASFRQQYDEIEFANICTNRHERCVFWASVGECKTNPGFMDNQCTLACQVCEKFIDASETIVAVAGGDSSSSSSSSSSSTDEFVDL